MWMSRPFIRSFIHIMGFRIMGLPYHGHTQISASWSPDLQRAKPDSTRRTTPPTTKETARTTIVMEEVRRACDSWVEKNPDTRQLCMNDTWTMWNGVCCKNNAVHNCRSIHCRERPNMRGRDGGGGVQAHMVEAATIALGVILAMPALWTCKTPYDTCISQWGRGK